MLPSSGKWHRLHGAPQLLWALMVGYTVLVCAGLHAHESACEQARACIRYSHAGTHSTSRAKYCLRPCVNVRTCVSELRGAALVSCLSAREV
eukprot:445605-Prymnesium_polylepis.1